MYCYWAVHLELSTVEKLISRNIHAWVLQIYIATQKLFLSDNNSQFQLVFQMELVLVLWTSKNFLALKRKNIIPKTPWSGGFYEIMIGLTKGVLGYLWKWARTIEGETLFREGIFLIFLLQVYRFNFVHIFFVTVEVIMLPHLWHQKFLHREKFWKIRKKKEKLKFFKDVTCLLVVGFTN